ncbi:MAG TPA: pyridoxamine 5'-phosphate oxidase [Trueperaceae bacterium]
MPLADLRLSYDRAGLELTDLDADPIAQFQRWLEEALAAQLPEPNAMTLATADAAGRPSARMVLLKRVDARGFVFYTNYQSRKGRELAENAQAALVFYWHALERQVRIEGEVSKLSREESRAYFDTRPRGSRLAAWVSKQSHEIETRALLEEHFRELEERFADRPVPLPDFWGGYLVTPRAAEFWQGRPNRLHDRFRYTRQEGAWRVRRLAP